MASRKEYELALKIGAKVDKSVDSSVSNIEKKLGSISGIASKAAAGVGAAFAAVKVGQFISDAVDTYKDYQSAISETAAIAGTSANDGTGNYEKLEKAAREAGRATTKTAEESAQALGYMALAGWNVDDSVSALQPILKMSTATNAELAYTSDLVTDSMANLGLGINDLNHYLDVSIQANNKSNQTAIQLQEAYLGVGGTFKNLKAPIEESAALLGVLANRGTKGSEAGTAMSAILVNMQKKTGDSAKAMKQLNVSMFDEAGNARSLIDVFQEINDKTAGMTTEQKQLIYQMIGGKSHLDSFSKIMAGFADETADGKKEIYSLVDALNSSDGALDRFYQVKTGTLGASMEILNSAVDDFKISLVEKFAPAATKAINHIAERIPELTDKVSEGIERIAPRVESTVDYVIDNSDEILEKIESAAKIGAAIWATDKVVKFGSAAINTINAINYALAAGNAINLFGGFGKIGAVISKITQATGAGYAAAIGSSEMTAAVGSASMQAIIDSGATTAAIGGEAAKAALSSGGALAAVLGGLVATYEVYKGISKGIVHYQQSLIDTGLEAGELSKGSIEIENRAAAVQKMYDEYMKINSLQSTGSALAEDEARRKELEQWFIDNYGQFISAEEQKNGIRQDSIDFINKYNQALKEQRASELEAVYQEAQTKAPQIQKEISEKTAKNNELAEQSRQAELTSVQLQTVKLRFDAINESMSGAERRKAVSDLMSQNKEVFDSYTQLTGNVATLGELDKHIDGLKDSSAEWNLQIQSNNEFITQNQKALEGYINSAKAMVEMDFGISFAEAAANGSSQFPVMKKQLEGILEVMNLLPDNKEISVSDTGTISFVERQLSQLEQDYRDMEFNAYITATDKASQKLSNVENQIDDLNRKKKIQIEVQTRFKEIRETNDLAQKWNIQQNAGGTSYADDIFIGGEEGLELVRPAHGNPFLIGQSGPEIVTGYKGAQVYSNSETKSMMKRNTLRTAEAALDQISIKNTAGGADAQSTGTPSFVYSPTIQLQGNASEAEVRNVLQMSYYDFQKMMDRYMRDKQRKEFLQ